MKKTSIWQIVALAFLLLVLYVASFGPACLLFSKFDPPPWADSAFWAIYWPIRLMMDEGPEPVERLFIRYGLWWIHLHGK